ncbi:MAG: DUF1624 domain-containing protein [Bacteroidetes bacterium]|nr:DUF1624 domain-containing protein [Bacteroidota bacterium]
MKRINSIDLLRGLVMIIMALDHVRDLLHTSSITRQPTDLSTTTPLLFFTRWITHLCAPTFVFLSGASAYLSMERRKDRKATGKFLLIRGLWLVALEFTLINFGIFFDIHFRIFVFDVIAAIGVGFIILSLLLRCPARVIAIIGLAIIFFHALTPLTPFFVPGAFPFGDRLFVMGYPPIPWLGIMLLGFASGRLFGIDTARQKFLKIGAASIALFVILRFVNIYGDPFPWTHRKSGLFTFLSFINLTKYPPSLDFCLLFLGIMFLILSAVQGIQNKWTAALCVYGKVPLFYFLIHWYIIHPLVFVMIFLQGFKTSDMRFGFNFGRPQIGSGLPLWGVYLVWIGLVAVMYPLCKWYGRYKATHRDNSWLRFL